jgi:hypothetical protein
MFDEATSEKPTPAIAPYRIDDARRISDAGDYQRRLVLDN